MLKKKIRSLLLQSNFTLFFYDIDFCICFFVPFCLVVQMNNLEQPVRIFCEENCSLFEFGGVQYA